MVFFNNFNLFGFKAWFTGRVRKVSENIAKVYGHYQTGLLCATYFGVSLVLGIVAFNCSREEAIEYWERTFLPSERIIRFAFGSRGLVVANDGPHFQRALKSLPTSLDEKGSIWLSLEPMWVAIFLPSQEHSQVEVVTYCLDCSVLPKNWEPMGIGWRGLDKAIERVDIGLKTLKVLKKGFLPKIRRDPREIVY